MDYTDKSWMQTGQPWNTSADPWAGLRDSWQQQGGYVNTGMDIPQFGAHQYAQTNAEKSMASDRQNLLAFLQQMQGMSGPSTASMDKAVAAADPFAGQRGRYQNQLNALMQNPGSFSSSPAYKFAFDQGLEAVNRNLAAKGLTNSGTRLAELTKFGQGMAGQQYFQQANLLSKLAGVDASNPGAAAGAITSISNQQNNPMEWAKLYESGRQANQQQSTNVAKLGNVLKPYYAYAGY